MTAYQGVSDPDTESDGETHSDKRATDTRVEQQSQWQSLFSTANLDNGRLTLKISHVEESHHQHHFRIPKLPELVRPAPVSKVATKSAFVGIDTPSLNVVIHIVGSRGDVQPYVALGKALQQPPYNHRVRLATHPNFKDFVEDNGLEFYSIGGDPEALMSYMIKNPGILPGRESIKAGDPSHRRADIAEMLQGCWRSCIERGDGMDKAPGLNKDGTPAKPPTTKPKHNEPFFADAIIANPPSYAHIHCAEKLSIPLQLTFTMPWSPTQAFPHPLANITAVGESKTLANYASFIITDSLTWQGLGDIFNDFRTKTLGLEPINPFWGANIIPRLRVPWTYCWSKALIPKPTDWDSHIDISGFYFLNLASSYTPPEPLQRFLDSGPPPVYIGFGSITLSKPKETMSMILEAVAAVGVRALVSKGWGGLQCDDPPDNVFMLDNCPHDWLFPRVSCVVHHGGAGTTAIGIKLGKPTVVIPFFGDQPFWGGMVYRAGAGPKPVPYKKLTAESLARCLETALKPQSLEKARILGERVKNEDGVAVGAQQFQESLDIDTMRCDILPDKVAQWKIKHTHVRLSMLAAAVLIGNGQIDAKDMQYVRHREWITDPGPMFPVGGAIAAIVSNATNAGMGIHKFNKAMRQMHRDSKAAKQASANEVKSDSNSETSSEANVSSMSGDDVLDNYLNNIQDDLFERDSLSLHSPQPRSGSSTPRLKDRFASAFDNITHRKSTDLVRPSKAASAQVHKANRMSIDEKCDRFKLHITRRGTFPGFPTFKPSQSNNQHLQGHNSGHLHTVAVEAARAANTVMQAGLNTPIELAYNLAAGFHNAPVLFFGDNVRPPPRVTGLKSGVRAAGEEFVMGFYEAITGLYTQPAHKIREEGWAKGLPKGIIAGVSGLGFKSSAAVLGIPGYLLKGLNNEIRRPAARTTDRRILDTKRLLNLDSLRNCSPETQQKVLDGWEGLVRRDTEAMEKEKMERRHGPSHWRTGRHGLSLCDDKVLPLKTLPHHKHMGHGHRDLAARLETATEKDLDEAVEAAVTDTSYGDPEEDKRIAEAVRASLMELRNGLKQKTTKDQKQDETKKGDGHNKATNGDVSNGDTEYGALSLDGENESDLATAAIEEDKEVGNGTHLLQYEVWKRICEAHMGITPQSQLGVAVAG